MVFPSGVTVLVSFDTGSCVSSFTVSVEFSLSDGPSVIMLLEFTVGIFVLISDVASVIMLMEFTVWIIVVLLSVLESGGFCKERRDLFV